MADVTVTAANVKPASGDARVQKVQYGETLTQSQPVYKSTDGKYYRADANDTLAKAAAVGMTLTPGVANDWGYILLDGPMDVGGTLSVGRIYVVSANVGKFCPAADLATGHYTTVLGVAITTSVLDVAIKVSGVAYA